MTELNDPETYRVNIYILYTSRPKRKITLFIQADGKLCLNGARRFTTQTEQQVVTIGEIGEIEKQHIPMGLERLWMCRLVFGTDTLLKL